MLIKIKGPGFGKTTAISIFAIALMARFGVICGSAPTHVAIDNFAARLHEVALRVVSRCNDGRDEAAKVKRKLVIRGYKMRDEVAAFTHLLQHPHAGDKAAPSSWLVPSRWRFNLSLAFWLLAVLRAPGPDLPDDHVPEALVEMRDAVDKRSDLDQLRAVAVGTISWEDYEKGAMLPAHKIEDLFEEVIRHAQVICTTPANACQEPFLSWKLESARAFAIDEAANMSRPDLLSVWGNTLLPCVLSGDDKQLSPTVMTMHEMDAQGNFVNRFGEDGKVSPLVFLIMAGWPVFRLRTQLRMARGLFDLCHQEVYSDVPFEYGPPCDIGDPKHEVGHALEAFFKGKFGMRPAPAGTMQPIFVHCPGSRCFLDKATGSKRSPDQARIALDLACDFVQSRGVDADKLVMISPYKANVEVIERLRRSPAYAPLAKMPPVATVDSFQGREGDVAFVCFGTTKAVGPGFTSDRQRLNVMLSRQRSGLVIVGDVNVTGDIEGGKAPADAKGKGKGKGKKGGNTLKVRVLGADGEWTMTRVTMLHNVAQRLFDAGRVVRVEAKE